MASFTTRVDLHGATYQDYLAFHAAMEQRGFSRTIKGDNGIWYHLPTAEYVSFGNIDRFEVLSLVKAAAQQVGKTASILVTETTAWLWDNLIQVG